MTTATMSAYPRSIQELLPAAREMADQAGNVPSRNELMRRFKVGAPKATELRQALLDQATPTRARKATPAAKPATPPAEPISPAPVIEAPAETDTSTEPAPDPVTPTAATVPATPDAVPTPQAVLLATVDGHPAPASVATASVPRRKPVTWPVLLLSLPAFVAIWSGWVELGQLSGFGIVHPLPGIADEVTFNTAITLPIGVETYAAYALWVWLSGRAPRQARRFAKWSALGSLMFGAAGQIAYHLMAAEGMTSAPWQITSAVACLPVAVLGMGAALAHLQHVAEEPHDTDRARGGERK